MTTTAKKTKAPAGPKKNEKPVQIKQSVGVRELRQSASKILDQVKMAFTVLDSSPGSLADTDIGKIMIKSVKKFEALILTPDKAKNFITEAASCASGQRVCIKLFPESDFV